MTDNNGKSFTKYVPFVIFAFSALLALLGWYVRTNQVAMERNQEDVRKLYGIHYEDVKRLQSIQDERKYITDIVNNFTKWQTEISAEVRTQGQADKFLGENQKALLDRVLALTDRMDRCCQQNRYPQKDMWWEQQRWVPIEVPIEWWVCAPEPWDAVHP